jgi:hypothetical protein
MNTTTEEDLRRVLGTIAESFTNPGAKGRPKDLSPTDLAQYFATRLINDALKNEAVGEVAFGRTMVDDTFESTQLIEQVAQVRAFLESSLGTGYSPIVAGYSYNRPTGLYQRRRDLTLMLEPRK